MIRKNLQQANKIIIDTENRIACKSCGLCRNQQPIFDKEKFSAVIWLGLSAVKIQNGRYNYPLSTDTKTGSLLYHIESLLQNVEFYRTNLVKCLPLRNEKIRYPVVSEMENCFPVFNIELTLIKPRIVILLGNQVSNFTLNKYDVKGFSTDPDFDYKSLFIDNITFIPVHHPSYILVYRRSQINKYATNIAKAVIKSLHEVQWQTDYSSSIESVINKKSEFLDLEKFEPKAIR